MRLVEAPCPLCGSRSRRPVAAPLRDIEDGVPGEYGICRCEACAALYLCPAPAPEALAQCYRSNYYARTDRTGTLLRRLLYGARAELRFRGLRRLLPAAGDLLEIGCGDGGVLMHLERRAGPALRLTGTDLEVSGIALPAGSRIRLVAGEIERLAFDGRFDVVLMFDVLEHLARPLETLRRVCGLLKDGGVLVGTVPEWDSPWRRFFPSHWGGLQVPRHQSFFTAALLERTLREAGFAAVGISRSFDPGDLSVTLCNWISDRLGLRTRPREAWFYLPVTVLATPVALLGTACFGRGGALTFTARRAAALTGGEATGAGAATPGP